MNGKKVIFTNDSKFIDLHQQLRCGRKFYDQYDGISDSTQGILNDCAVIRAKVFVVC